MDQVAQFDNVQQVSVAIQFLDAANNPVAVTGVPVWEVADTTIVTAEVAADGLSALIKSVGAVGSTVVTVSLDTISGSFQVVVTPSGAVAIQFTISDPQPRA